MCFKSNYHYHHYVFAHVYDICLAMIYVWICVQSTDVEGEGQLSPFVKSFLPLLCEHWGPSSGLQACTLTC